MVILRAVDVDDFVLQGMVQHFQHTAVELGHLVQEQHPAVFQADFAWSGLLSATHKPGIADGTVRGRIGA